MSDETVTAVPPQETPAQPAATEQGTTKTEPTQAQPEPDFRQAYEAVQKDILGMQRAVSRTSNQNSSLLRQNQALFATVEALKGDLDAQLKQTLGEDGYKERVVQRAQTQERVAALQAAQAAEAFVPVSIDVLSNAMRAAGVSDNDISAIFTTARNAGDIGEWAEYTKVATAQAIVKARAADQSKHESKNREEVQAEARALAERELRKSGIDRVDTGKGTGTTSGSTFVDRLRRIDRNTAEGEAEYQSMKKDAYAGRLKI